MFQKYSVYIIFIFATLGCKVISIEKNSINPLDVFWYGRVATYADESKVNLISTAACGGFQTNDDITIYASTSKNNFVYLQVEQNSELLSQKYKITDDTLNRIIIPVKGPTRLWLYKCSEAHTGPLYIHKLEGNSIRPIKKTWNKKIEFIGNSITCGAASDTSIKPCGNGNYNYHHNGYMSYAAQCGRRLDARTLLSSISGAGIYRNWNSDGPTVPQLYSYLNLKDSLDGQWNASAYQPDLIVVALGTNDLSRGDGVKARHPFSQEQFVKTYISFLNKITEWNPEAKIVITDSPMVTGERTVLNSCLNIVKDKMKDNHGKEIYLFTYTPMKARGCTGHPSVEDHTIMANELTPYLEQILINNNK